MNKIVARIIPILVPGFWDTNTGICAGAMSYRRDFTATTGIKAFEEEKGMIRHKGSRLRGSHGGSSCGLLPALSRSAWHSADSRSASKRDASCRAFAPGFDASACTLEITQTVQFST